MKRTHDLLLKKVSEDLGILQCDRAGALHGRVLALGEPPDQTRPFQEPVQPTNSMRTANKDKN